MSVSWFEFGKRSETLIVVRCRGCGNSIGNPLEEHKRNEYTEKLSDKPCMECAGKVTTAEAKLLEAIFGETSWD